MLLIDDDQTERWKGQPQRGPGADHDLCPALGDGAPGLAALARAELGMPDRGLHTEACAKAPQPLSAERDLGQHHHHLMACIERRGDGLEIDLGLAGAGYAVENGDREFPGGDCLSQCVSDVCLRIGQDRAGTARIGAAKGRDLAHRDRLDRAEGSQATHHGGSHIGFARDLGGSARRPVLQKREHATSGFRHSRCLVLPTPVRGPHRRRLHGGRHAHRHTQNGAALCKRVVGRPIDQAAERLGHRRRLQHCRHRLETRRLHVAFALTPDHADALHPAERHAHEGAGRNVGCKLFRHGVVVSAVERQRQQDGDGSRWRRRWARACTPPFPVARSAHGT